MDVHKSSEARQGRGEAARDVKVVLREYGRCLEVFGGVWRRLRRGRRV
jgi:hypothetical protein